ncbi:predicted protein [Aspergillus terreus NIH2624]|uniref:Uncharacterized protein n=1 Tax=Aspergillus terreus (strain NIH 2624 / FGSC A1156) TaxID=341663 RepID=Q0CIV8_ASPTN|nr:uncharacterized protein ATEG_06376 [Aspergillus terreus NIH2624]EAU32920.1 predicted protein [Aspergillus terreus NIH2624]
MTPKRENKTTAGDPGRFKRRKKNKNKKPAAAAAPAPAPPPAPAPAPAPAEPALPEEVLERLRREAREQVYKELDLDIEIDEPAPAAAEPAQELTPGQRLCRDELLGRLQEVKDQRANLKAEKRALKAQILELEERVEWYASALKACDERFKTIVGNLKALEKF